MKDKTLLFILVGLLVLINSLFFFSSGTETEIEDIQNISEIPKDPTPGKCWRVEELKKIICFSGQVNVSSGSVAELEK